MKKVAGKVNRGAIAPPAAEANALADVLQRIEENRFVWITHDEVRTKAESAPTANLANWVAESLAELADATRHSRSLTRLAIDHLGGSDEIDEDDCEAVVVAACELQVKNLETLGKIAAYTEALIVRLAKVEGSNHD